ncbi:unnamed protein product [Clonostachys rosea]|uniref:SCP domain-containing protein n=1 Tax=Bionectria ochroleuca TaxID=29856 RepID=A0ABY6TS25_BIOOC|nr:unnamed protein product [Clonostachys rosea]
MGNIQFVFAAFFLCLWQLASAHYDLSPFPTIPVDGTITALPSLATTGAAALEERAEANTQCLAAIDLSRHLWLRANVMEWEWARRMLRQRRLSDLHNMPGEHINWRWSCQGLSYAYYSCAESRTTISVSMDTGPTGSVPSDSSLFSSLFSSAPTTSSFSSTARASSSSKTARTSSAGTGAPEPTTTGNDNTPGLGLESDLGANERTKAAVGSAILGGVLLGSFLLFSCFFNPPGSDDANEENQPSPPPSENAGLLVSGQEMHTPASTVSETRFYGQQPMLVESGREMHSPEAPKQEGRFYQQPVIYHPQVEYA